MRQPDFWTRKDLSSRLRGALLAPVGYLYGKSIALRARFTEPLRVNAKIVCVGNLTAGGTGKTPVATAIAKALRTRGFKTIFLTRGYGGRAKGPLLVDSERHPASEVGDEALLLARAAPVIVARDRRAGAKAAISFGADIIVMDDGHQNFQLTKDLSIVVVDAANPFGSGRLLPAGPLRESPAQGLKRADAIIAMGDGSPAFGAMDLPILRARLEPLPETDFKGKRVFAFAGIGQPNRFFDTLRALGAHLADTKIFGDHHAYTTAEINALDGTAQASQAMLVTTEKDWVRLAPAEKSRVAFVAVHAVFNDAGALDQLLDRVAPRTT